MFLSVSRENSSLILTAFTQNSELKPEKFIKLEEQPLAIESLGVNFCSFSDKGEVLVYDSAMQCTDEIKVCNSKGCKFASYSDKICVYAEQLSVNSSPGISVFEVVDHKLQLLNFFKCEKPTHVACSNQIVAGYFKTGKTQFELVVFDVVEKTQQVFNMLERCKTLRFDWNGELVLITKNAQKKYTFERFYSAEQVRNDNDNETFEQVQDTIENPDEESSGGEEIMSPTYSGDATILQTSPAKMLSYQFRTCIPSENVVLAGRFDSYVAMENKSSPISCIIHSHYIIGKSIEKVCADWTKEGYFICYVSQDQHVINIVRQYNLEKEISVKAKDIEKFSLLNVTQKIDDLILLTDNTLICLCNQCLISFGCIGNVIMQKELEMQRFCFDKDRQSVLFINSENIMLYYVENGEFKCVREVAQVITDNTELVVEQTDSLIPEYVEFNRDAKVTKYFKKDASIEIHWQQTMESEPKKSLIEVEEFE